MKPNYHFATDSGLNPPSVRGLSSGRLVSGLAIEVSVGLTIEVCRVAGQWWALYCLTLLSSIERRRWQKMANPIVITAAMSSTISGVRRKPRFTYQSPCPTQSKSTNGSEILIMHKLDTPVAIPTFPIVPPATTIVTRRTTLTLIPTRPKHMLEPPLPLYHPLGKLAMSLPELDAERYGLPIPARLRDREVNIDDDKPSSSSNGKRPARSRKPVAKLRDGEADDDGQGKDEEAEGESEESKQVNVEIKEKEKVSPKKRRNGGNKRKRKDADDGDSAYPAKRARNPRGVNHAQNNIQEDEGVAEIPDGSTAIDFEDKTTVPERRTTRARANGNGGSTKRRDSTASSGSAESKDKAEEHSKAPSEEQDEAKHNDENSTSN